MEIFGLLCEVMPLNDKLSFFVFFTFLVCKNLQKEEKKLMEQKRKDTMTKTQKKNKDLEDQSLPPINMPNNQSIQSKNKGTVTKIKKKKSHWLDLLDELHADALISDAFWYIICKICNPKPEFEQH